MKGSHLLTSNRTLFDLKLHILFCKHHICSYSSYIPHFVLFTPQVSHLLTSSIILLIESITFIQRVLHLLMYNITHFFSLKHHVYSKNIKFAHTQHHIHSDSVTFILIASRLLMYSVTPFLLQSITFTPQASSLLTLSITFIKILSRLFRQRHVCSCIASLLSCFKSSHSIHKHQVCSHLASHSFRQRHDCSCIASLLIFFKFCNSAAFRRPRGIINHFSKKIFQLFIFNKKRFSIPAKSTATFKSDPHVISSSIIEVTITLCQSFF